MCLIPKIDLYLNFFIFFDYFFNTFQSIFISIQVKIPLRDSLLVSHQVFNFFFIFMPNCCTNEEYADMLFVYGFSDGNALQAEGTYRRRYPSRRIAKRHTIP